MLSRSAHRSALGLCLTAIALAGAVGTPFTAQAKPPASKSAKQPIGVGAFSGPQGSKVRGKVMKILRDSGSYELTDLEDVKPGASTQTIQQNARGIQAEAIVLGTVSKAPNLTLTVYGANGARIDSIQVKGGSFPKLYKAIDNEVEIAIADPLERAHSAGGGKPAAAAAAAAAPAKAKAADAEPAPQAAAKSDDEEEAPVDEAAEASSSSSEDESSAPAAASEESERGLRPIEIGVGLRLYNRNFAYTGLTTSNLIPYNLPLAPTIWVAGTIYPGALWSNGPFSNIGLTGRYEYGLATTTSYEQPTGMPGQTVVTELQTHAYEYQFGLRGRIPIGRHELGISGVYGNQSFVLQGDEDPAQWPQKPYALVPDVHYHYLRFGLDARFYISKLLVGAHVAPRFLTSMKELDKGGVWFPGAMGSGLDMGAQLGWQILPWLTPTAGFDLVRYGFDFNNVPVAENQRVIAGGATDTYLSGWIGAVFNLDFASSSAGGAVAAEAKPEEESEAKTEDAAEPEDEAAEKAEPPPKPKAQPKAQPKEEAPPPKPKASSKKPIQEEEEEEEIE